MSELDFISLHLLKGNIDKGASMQVLHGAAPLGLCCIFAKNVVSAASLPTGSPVLLLGLFFHSRKNCVLMFGGAETNEVTCITEIKIINVIM